MIGEKSSIGGSLQRRKSCRRRNETQTTGFESNRTHESFTCFASFEFLLMNAIEFARRPILLLADSSLLYYRSTTTKEKWLDMMLRKLLSSTEDQKEQCVVYRSLKVAYLGANNNDAPSFFEILQG